MIATYTLQKDVFAEKKYTRNRKQVNKAKQDLFIGDNTLRKKSNKVKKKLWTKIIMTH